jgi:hypothetical protein
MSEIDEIIDAAVERYEEEHLIIHPAIGAVCCLAVVVATVVVCYLAYGGL